DEERSKAILDRIPAGRWGVPADLGGTAVFLASRASDYVNGAVIPVDGGWLPRCSRCGRPPPAAFALALEGTWPRSGRPRLASSDVHPIPAAAARSRFQAPTAWHPWEAP